MKRLAFLSAVVPIFWASLQAQPFAGGNGPFPIPASGLGPLLTNISMVRSVDIPIGAWTTNGVDSTIASTITAAQLAAVTNNGDGAIFSHTNGTATITNCLRTRFSLPWDWDAGTVEVGLLCVCGATNSSVATNMVWAIRAAAISATDNATNLTFGSFVRVTNNIGTNAWVYGQEGITTALTVGNSPSTSKGILWEIQRHGADGGDTETNFPLFLAQVRVYYKTTSLTNFPTASP